MSKITKYLNEHLLGSATASLTERDNYSSDNGVLSERPDLVVTPRCTNDIRKVMRFSWQLAEKGHVLGVTARGLGGDTTGGSVGSGAILDLSKHLNSVLYISGKEKNKITHVQSGVSMSTLYETLRWSGLTVDAYAPYMSDMTLGGMIASGQVTDRSYRYQSIAESIEKMEIVLANGDLMEIGTVSKREVNKKRGEQTLEGEIYRGLDTLFEEEAELISKLSSSNDNYGYAIDKVKQKDGSFNLTPLFVGSQGTLGVVSEVVLKVAFYNGSSVAAVAVFDTPGDAIDKVELIKKLNPTTLNLYSNDYLSTARAHGKKFIFDGKGGMDTAGEQYAVLVTFDDFNSRVRQRKLKQLDKIFGKDSSVLFTSDDYPVEEVTQVRDVRSLILTPTEPRLTTTRAIDGAYIPAERLSLFIGEASELAKKDRLTLPLSVDVLNGIVSASLALPLKEVSGKQKVFRSLSSYAKLVNKCDGAMSGGHAEGQLGNLTARDPKDSDIIALNERIRKIFDPYGTLNPGVKQKNELKDLVSKLKS